MSTSHRNTHLSCLIICVALCLPVITTAVMVDDFEQDNGNNNSLGYWSAMWVDTNTSTAGFIPDNTGASKNGSRGGVLYYSNGVAETAQCTFYTVVATNTPYLDLSNDTWYVRFWIKGNEGTPAIDKVILEGGDTSRYGRVSFADYNGGTNILSPDWYEVSIPVTNFMNDTGGGFSLSRVSLVAMTFDPDSSTDRFSSLYIDSIQVATNAAPPPQTGTPVTNTLVVDDFEQNNDKPNTLGYWSDMWVDSPASVGGFIPDIGGAQKNGSLGAVLYYSNGVAESAQCKFYSVLETNWPYLDLSDTNLHLRFWIKGNEGTPAFDKVILEGNDSAQYGRVDFADYNGGSSALELDWTEISIPAADFLGDSAGAFTLTKVQLLALTIEPNSSTAGFSSVYLDDIHFATNAAPPPPTPTPVTNNLVIDDFEQNNGQPNTLGFWSDVYVGNPTSFAGLIPDTPGVQKNGANGGIIFYSNGAPESVQCKFYTVLDDTWPYYDLTQPGLHVRFWVKGNDGTPAIDKVILESGDPSKYGQVDFSSYNGESSYLAADWYEISIPVPDFLGDTSAGFSLSKVSLLGFTLVSDSSTGQFSSFYLDDFHFATNAAVPPAPAVVVTNTLVIDNFEQSNDKPNTLGHWSDMYFNSDQSFAGFIPDFAGAEYAGSYGGILFYSNSPAATVPCLFYSVLSDTWPYMDMSDPSLNVEFWIRGDEDGLAVIDHVVLEGDTAASYGQVDFADYNGGSNEVATAWKHISIPATNFLQDAGGGFSLARVKLFGLKMDPASSVGLFSSAFLDDIRIFKPGTWVDVALSKTALPGVLLADSNITYTVYATNTGPASAANVVITDTLPAGVTFNAAGSSPGCSEAGGIVTCNLGSLASGGDTSLTIAVSVDASVTGTITNFASAATSSTDVNTLNNTATAEALVADTDGDGDPDFHDPDDDNDGIPDDWEDHFFGGSTNAVPDEDGDGDGATNYEEFGADTDPGDSNSVFEIYGFSMISPPTVTFTSSASRVYDVQYSADLQSGTWTDLATDVPGNDGVQSVADPGAASYRSYRVKVRIP